MLHLHTAPWRRLAGLVGPAAAQCAVTWAAWGSLRAGGVGGAVGLSAGLLAGFAAAAALPWWAGLAAAAAGLASETPLGFGVASAALGRALVVAVASGSEGADVRRTQEWLAASFVGGLVLALALPPPPLALVAVAVAPIAALRPWAVLRRSTPRPADAEAPSGLTALALADGALFAALVLGAASVDAAARPAFAGGAVAGWAAALRLAPSRWRVAALGVGATVCAALASAPWGAAAWGFGAVAAHRLAAQAPARLVYSGRPRVGAAADALALAGAAVSLGAAALVQATGWPAAWVAVGTVALGALALLAAPAAALSGGPGWISKDQARNGAARAFS